MERPISQKKKKPTMKIRSKTNGKVYNFPMQLYKILVDKELKNADKVFFITEWIIENNTDYMGIDDFIAEKMALGLFEDIMSKQCYKLLLSEYQKKYGFRETDTEWVEDFKQMPEQVQVLKERKKNNLQ